MSAAGPATSTLRRLWPALVSLVLLAGLWTAHTLAFRPLAVRYRAQLAGAGDVGASLDPRLAEAPLPPRVVDLLRSNSLLAADAERLGQSGSLATDLVRRLSEAATGCGITVAASEPGTATQTASTLEVRAHVRLRCRFGQLVELLDELSAERALYRVERLSLAPQPENMLDAELWVARVMIKRGSRPS